MPAIASTSGRLHSEFACLVFLQTHWETDHFLAASGVHLAQTTLTYRRTTFCSQIKSNLICHIVTKAVALWIMLNIEEEPIASRTHTHPSHSQNSRLMINLVYISVRCSSSTCIYARSIDPSVYCFYSFITPILTYMYAL